jgi:hypothetical protein
MIIQSIAPGAPYKGKLQVGGGIIRIEHENNVWDTFMQFKAAVLGSVRVSTTTRVHMVRGVYSIAYHREKIGRNATSQIMSVFYSNLAKKSRHLNPEYI